MMGGGFTDLVNSNANPNPTVAWKGIGNFKGISARNQQFFKYLSLLAPIASLLIQLMAYCSLFYFLCFMIWIFVINSPMVERGPYPLKIKAMSQ